MDLSRHAQPKPAPGTAQREKRQRRARLTAQDRAENAKVKARSGGRCEMLFAPDGRHHDDPQCNFRAAHIHHLIGGIGRRGRAESSKAIRKVHLCMECHADIHAHVLVRVGGPVPHYTDSYKLVR